MTRRRSGRKGRKGRWAGQKLVVSGGKTEDQLRGKKARSRKTTKIANQARRNNRRKR